MKLNVKVWHSDGVSYREAPLLEMQYMSGKVEYLGHFIEQKWNVYDLMNTDHSGILY